MDIKVILRFYIIDFNGFYLLIAIIYISIAIINKKSS